MDIKSGDYVLELYVRFIRFIHYIHYYFRPSGYQFSVPSSDTTLPSLGDVVTFTYTSTKNDNDSWVPIDPVLSHVRKDINWKDIVIHSRRLNELNGMNNEKQYDKETNERSADTKGNENDFSKEESQGLLDSQ